MECQHSPSDTLSILDATESLNKIESDVPIETKVIIQAQDIGMVSLLL